MEMMIPDILDKVHGAGVPDLGFGLRSRKTNDAGAKAVTLAVNVERWRRECPGQSGRNH